MASPVQLLRDARTLGRWAPVRLTYEAAKAGGIHDLVFGRLKAIPRPLVSTDLGLSTPPTEAIERSREVADRAAAGSLELFDRKISFEGPIDWLSRVETPGSWPRDPWWKLDVRAGAVESDPKWTWELGRLEHLVSMARVVKYQPTEVVVAELGLQIERWFEQNPFEQGFHWYSNLEIALRIVRWTELINLAGTELGSTLVDRIAAEVAHSVAHLLVELPYTVSSMRNNHLLGDALGLLAAEQLTHPSARRPAIASIGQRIFANQLQRQVRPDGSMLDNSLSYHRFVMDMFVLKLVLDPADNQTRTALQDSAQYLARLGVFEGQLPQYGDWDGGRALVATGDRHDLRGIAALGLSLAGTGASEEWRASYDECAFYVGIGTPQQAQPAERNGRDVGGGIARAERGKWRVWLKQGFGPSHQHADGGSVVIHYDGQPIVVDPGTGTYNGEPQVRNEFRSTAAHATLQLDGQDQLVPTRTFRYQHSAQGAIGKPFFDDDVVVMWGAHDAYRRLDPPSTVLRAVVVRASGVLVIDFVENGSHHTGQLTVPLHPNLAGLCGLERIGLKVRFHDGIPTEAQSQFSTTLGSVQKSTTIGAASAAVSTAWWWLGGVEPAAASCAETLVTGDLEIRPRFTHLDWSLSVRRNDEQHLFRATADHDG